MLPVKQKCGEGKVMHEQGFQDGEECKWKLETGSGSSVEPVEMGANNPSRAPYSTDPCTALRGALGLKPLHWEMRLADQELVAYAGWQKSYRNPRWLQKLKFPLDAMVWSSAFGQLVWWAGESIWGRAEDSDNIERLWMCFLFGLIFSGNSFAPREVL